MKTALYLYLFFLSTFLSQKVRANCSTPTAIAGTYQWFSASNDFKYCDGFNWTSMAVTTTADACANPTGAGKLTYNAPELQFCDGSHWVNVSGNLTGDTCPSETSGTLTYDSGATYMKWCDSTNRWRVTKPSKSYFVLTAGTHDGNFGGVPGADAFCLSDLRASTFLDKEFAVLDANHVKAFICGSYCNNLEASSIYYFARAGSATDGGATLSTNASQQGPGAGGNWAGSTFFNTGVHFYSNRGSDDIDPINYWKNVPKSATTSCTDFSSNSSAVNGRIGATNGGNGNRWIGGSDSCDTANHLVCFVNQ